jgi:hypothetical protein
MNPYLKFVRPALLALAATAVAAISQGTFDGPAFEIGFVGLAAASISFMVTNATGGIQAYMKAIAPAALTAIGILVHYTIASEFNAVDLRIALAGGLAALVTLVSKNTA